jgi:bifunctional DNA-binding transcriptional regulator/antitoxin component of YhaV-PrlF toxin-antitoxin module
VELVYGQSGASVNSEQPSGEYRSGQTGRAVNALAKSFAGSNPASPIPTSVRVKPTKYERKFGRHGQTIVNYKRRVTIPQNPFFKAGLEAGDRLRVRCEGDGRLILERIGLPPWARSDMEHPDSLPANGQPQLELD